jgi:hypothetical protein
VPCWHDRWLQRLLPVRDDVHRGNVPPHLAGVHAWWASPGWAGGGEARSRRRVLTSANGPISDGLLEPRRGARSPRHRQCSVQATGGHVRRSSGGSVGPMADPRRRGTRTSGRSRGDAGMRPAAKERSRTASK